MLVLVAFILGRTEPYIYTDDTWCAYFNIIHTYGACAYGSHQRYVGPKCVFLTSGPELLLDCSLFAINPGLRRAAKLQVVAFSHKQSCCTDIVQQRSN